MLSEHRNLVKTLVADIIYSQQTIHWAPFAKLPGSSPFVPDNMKYEVDTQIMLVFLWCIDIIPPVRRESGV